MEKQIMYRYASDASVSRVTRLIKSEIDTEGPCIEALVSQDRFVTYRGMDRRVCTLLDYFHVSYNQMEVGKKVAIFSIWIKSVDDMMDELDSRDEVIARIKNRQVSFDNEARQDSTLFLTELLKKKIAPENYDSVCSVLFQHYYATQEEKGSRSMAEYIQSSKHVGKTAAEVVYKLIEPDLSGNQEKFHIFFSEACELADLVDACFDIKQDVEKGALPFRPSWKDMIELYAATAKAGIKIALNYPGLSVEFLKSIRRNLRHIIHQ
ncbi:hypothetical protein HY638_01800 [Candidatus Woesearchaeota archaeon]|nr:hypothetical protein [Candidatus Woesearchaeota archaeon]